MDSFVVAAALASALLHAAWNAAAKSRSDPAEGFAVAVYAAGVASLPLLVFTGLPAPAAWPWIAGGVILNVLSMRLLMAAYARTAFAIGYPVARGLTPALVTLAAFLLLGERPGALQIAGIGAIVLALLSLAIHARRRGHASPAGLTLAAGSSVLSAGYVFMDAQGVRVSGSILAYAVTLAVINAMVLGGLRHLEGRSPWRLAPADWGFGFAASLASMTSYMLVLWAFTVAPAGPVAALRETSVLFATLFAAVGLKERVGPVEWTAAAVAVAGIAAIRLG